MFVEHSFFWFFAMTGSGLFLIQLLLNLFGADHDDADSGKFKWLTKQALTGFFLMFGWAGLTCRKEFGLSLVASSLISVIAGIGAVFLTALLFNGARKLRSSGTVFRIEDAVGQDATVYQRIMPGGIGKISISLNHFTHEIDATAEEEIPSFSSVHVIKKTDENTVFVTRR